MKKILIIIVISASTLLAEKITYKDIYLALRHYESVDGKKMYDNSGRGFGWLHISDNVVLDFNKRNPKNKVVYKDLFNENKSYKIMVDHMKHYSKAYKKRGGIPDVRYLFSLWRHGNKGTIIKGKWNNYSAKLMRIMKEQMKATAIIRKSQRELYAGRKK